MRSTILKRFGLANGWAQEAAVAAVTLGIGFGAMPMLIYLAGSTLLGRYDNGNPARIYDGIYQGLGLGSVASWVVVLGPYGLYLLFRALRFWWRASARLA
jgi:hypothetical protein